MIDCVTGNGSSGGEGLRPGDPELLRRYIEERDESAFGELVQRHLDFVYSAALHRLGGDAHSAADVAQQVFTALAHRADTLARGAVLPGWLYATTRHLTADLVRSECRRRAREREACTMDELNSAPPPSVDWERLRPMLDQVLDELGERDRNAVVLRFFARRPFAEIGVLLQVSEDAARMRVDRALDKLRALLAERGITSTSAALATVLANQVAAAAPAGLASSITSAALTSAATAEVGALAAITAFMTATKTTVVLGIAAALTVTTAVYQSNQARAAAMELATARKQHAATRARLADLATKARAAEQALANGAQTVAQAAAARTALQRAPGAAAAREKAATYQKALQQFLDNHPQFQPLNLKAEHAWTRCVELPFFLGLGLTPEQADQAFELTQEAWARRKAQVKAGLNPPPDHSAFRAAFGDAATERWIEYNKVRWDEGEVVSNLIRCLYYTDEPYTVQQAKRLLEIVKQAQTQSDYSLRDARYDWDRILVEAEPILSPAQMQGLRARAAQLRLDQLWAAATKEAAAAAR